MSGAIAEAIALYQKLQNEGSTTAEEMGQLVTGVLKGSTGALRELLEEFSTP